MRESKIVRNVIVTIHGIRKGDTMKALRGLIKRDECFSDYVIETLDYGYVYAIVNYIPILRSITAKLVASFLHRIQYQYPHANVTVLAHSNGTWAIGRALETWKEKSPFFYIHKLQKLLLFGSVLKRNFDWNRFENIEVTNFVSANDKVVLFAKPFYGMGWSGRYGFKTDAPNLRQIQIDTGHTGFLAEYDIIRNVVFDKYKWLN